MVAFLLIATTVLISAAGPMGDWNTFEKAIRDQQIKKSEAKTSLPVILASLFEYANKYTFTNKQKWIFPIRGFSRNDAGKGGFRPDIIYGSSPIKGYDFYDGNLHGGHPAYDLFIHDKNLDCIDDHTKRPVEIVAPIDLLIISISTGWEKGSEQRGGNYIWGLNSLNNQLIYFAHMDSITVRSGDFCNAGKVLGTVGRSGKNAAPARSPTHLHMMVLTIENGQLIPFDYWEDLK